MLQSFSFRIYTLGYINISSVLHRRNINQSAEK